MNFARLNHILIPSTLEGRERLRQKRLIRLLRPVSWFYGALSDEGRVMSLLVLFVATASLEVSRTEVYILWAVLFGLMVASVVIRRLYSLKGVTVVTNAPERMTVGAEMSFRITVRNVHHASHHALRLRGPFLPWDGAFLGALPRLGELRPGSAWTSEVRARFIERGPHHIEPFATCALLPLGLAVGPSVSSRGCRFTVVPRIAAVQALTLNHGTGQERGTVRRSLRRGEAMEILGVRPYRRGDALRDLHPKTWARSGIPHVRQYQRESSSKVAVLVDSDRTTSTEAGFEAVLSLAAGVIAKVSASEELVAALALGARVSFFTTTSPRANLDRALDLLAHAKPEASPELDNLIEELTPLFATVSSVIVVTQSPDPSRLQLVAELQQRQIAARLLRVHDDTGPKWLASRRHCEPARSAAEVVVSAKRIAGEEPLIL